MKARIAILVGLVLLTLLMVASFVDLPWNEAAETTESEEVALFLFQDYLVSILVIALLLAVAMVAGIFLARVDEGEEMP